MLLRVVGWPIRVYKADDFIARLANHAAGDSGRVIVVLDYVKSKGSCERLKTARAFAVLLADPFVYTGLFPRAKLRDAAAGFFLGDRPGDELSVFWRVEDNPPAMNPLDSPAVVVGVGRVCVWFLETADGRVSFILGYAGPVRKIS